MEIQILKYFIAVYRKSSFVEVAKDFNMAPSSISRAISLLEDDLEVRLFNRTTRKVLATEEGQAYFNRIGPIVEEWEQANLEIKELRSGPKGVIRVTCPISFGYIYLSKMIPKYLKKYPDVEVELLMNDAQIDLINERIDLAIRFGHLKDSTYISTKLAKLNYIVCAGPQYLEKNTPIKKPQDIQSHNCLGFVFPTFNIRWKFKKGKKEIEIPIKSRLRVTSALSLLELAKKNEGVALLPQILIHKELKNGKLINLFPDYEVTASEFGSAAYILYPSRSYLSFKTRTFIDFMKASFLEELDL